MNFFLTLLMTVSVYVLGVGTQHASAQDCDCGVTPFVQYILSQEEELYGNPWRVAVISHYDIDLTQVDEPEICEVKLDLIPVTDPILYKDFESVPDGDFEVNFEGHWMLASQFEAMMEKSSCLTDNGTS